MSVDKKQVMTAQEVFASIRDLKSKVANLLKVSASIDELHGKVESINRFVENIDERLTKLSDFTKDQFVELFSQLETASTMLEEVMQNISGEESSEDEEETEDESDETPTLFLPSLDEDEDSSDSGDDTDVEIVEQEDGLPEKYWSEGEETA